MQISHGTIERNVTILLVLTLLVFFLLEWLAN